MQYIHIYSAYTIHVLRVHIQSRVRAVHTHIIPTTYILPVSTYQVECVEHTYTMSTTCMQTFFADLQIVIETRRGTYNVQCPGRQPLHLQSCQHLYQTKQQVSNILCQQSSMYFYTPMEISLLPLLSIPNNTTYQQYSMSAVLYVFLYTNGEYFSYHYYPGMSTSYARYPPWYCCGRWSNTRECV